MSTPENPQYSPREGSVAASSPDDRRRRRRPAWLIWLLLGIIALVVLLLLLSRCGDNSSTSTNTTMASPSSPATSASASATSSTTTPTASPTAPAGAGAGAGAVAGTGLGALTATGNGAAVLPLAASVPDGGLAALAGQAVTGERVLVQSVPADEGFWVGDSATDRVWVQLKGSGESSFTVKAGDHVSFTGAVEKNADGFADAAGVTTDEGGQQLTAQGNHVVADRASLMLAN